MYTGSILSWLSPRTSHRTHLSVTTVQYSILLLPHLFPLYVGSMCLMRRLHLARSCASSPDNSLSDKSFLMLSNHLLFGLPLLLFLGASIPITLFNYVFVFSSQYMPISLQPTFLHFLGYFSHLRCPSNSFIPNSVQLSDSTHPSEHPHFRHIQLLLVCFLHCQRLGTVHHCWSYNCLLYFLFDSQTYSSVAQNPRYTLPVFPS